MTRPVALVVRGGWPGHDPVGTTDEFLPFLEAEGYDVVVADDAEVYSNAQTMASIDLVMQSVTMGQASRESIRGLADAVATGTGLVGWHGGIVDAFANPAYHHLVGGVFAHHPSRVPPHERAGDGTDNFVEHRIDIVPENAEHPIVSGLSGFAIDSEQYWVLTDAGSEVLATTTVAARAFDPWDRPVTCPAIWTRRWGRGRVVVVTPGHRLADLRVPSVRTIIERGIRWATR